MKFLEAPVIFYMDNNEEKELKTALVTIIGRPSSGKSTFLNTACQEPVSIVSPIPQTTRNAIRGIVNTSFGQLVFVDTPGYHQSEKKLNLKLQKIAEDQLNDADCVLYILDTTRECGEEEQLIADLVKKYSDKTVVALNKTDVPNCREIKTREFVKLALPKIPEERKISISAKDDTGINEVLKALYDISPVAPQLYPEDLYTDQGIEFRVAEIIREQAINRLSQEIPHAIYVDVADCESRGPNKIWIRAFICVERESQKGIVIGKGASMIKTIKVESIKSFRKVFDFKIELDLQVKVDKNWRQKDYTLKKLLDV